MKLHFAGSDGNQKYNELLHNAGAKCRLESFYTLQNKMPSNKQFDQLLDSGGFVARTKGIIIKVEDYAKYINASGVQKAFNLDTNDHEETMANQKYLEENCPNCYIIPIYHLSDYLENKGLLKEFIDAGYPYIGIGGVAGEGSPIKLQNQFYNYIFSITRDKIKLHGLGITGEPMLQKYPWYSVDSTSWLSFARYANSKANSKKMAQVKAKTKHYLENTQEEAHHWVEIQNRMTRLWERRGIKWSNTFTYNGLTITTEL